MRPSFSRSTIENRLKAMIAEIAHCDESLLTLKTSLVSDENNDQVLHIDSLELAEILIMIDEEFGVNIPDEQVKKLSTINHLVDYIVSHTINVGG